MTHTFKFVFSLRWKCCRWNSKRKRNLKLSWLIFYLNIMLKCTQSRWLIKYLMATMVTPILIINFLYVYIQIPHRCSNFLGGRLCFTLVCILKIIPTFLTLDLPILSKILFGERALRIWTKHKSLHLKYPFLNICSSIIIILPDYDFWIYFILFLILSIHLIGE